MNEPLHFYRIQKSTIFIEDVLLYRQSCFFFHNHICKQWHSIQLLSPPSPSIFLYIIAPLDTLYNFSKYNYYWYSVKYLWSSSRNMYTRKGSLNVIFRLYDRVVLSPRRTKPHRFRTWINRTTCFCPFLTVFLNMMSNKRIPWIGYMANFAIFERNYNTKIKQRRSQRHAKKRNENCTEILCEYHQTISHLGP